MIILYASDSVCIQYNTTSLFACTSVMMSIRAHGRANDAHLINELAGASRDSSLVPTSEGGTLAKADTRMGS